MNFKERFIAEELDYLDELFTRDLVIVCIYHRGFNLGTSTICDMVATIRSGEYHYSFKDDIKKALERNESRLRRFIFDVYGRDCSEEIVRDKLQVLLNGQRVNDADLCLQVSGQVKTIWEHRRKREELTDFLFSENPAGVKTISESVTALSESMRDLNEKMEQLYHAENKTSLNRQIELHSNIES